MKRIFILLGILFSFIISYSCVVTGSAYVNNTTETEHYITVEFIQEQEKPLAFKYDKLKCKLGASTHKKFTKTVLSEVITPYKHKVNIPAKSSFYLGWSSMYKASWFKSIQNDSGVELLDEDRIFDNLVCVNRPLGGYVAVYSY